MIKLVVIVIYRILEILTVIAVFLAIFFLFKIVSTYAVSNEVPLLYKTERDMPFTKLQRHYFVRVTWGDDLSKLATGNAMDAWNKAAGVLDLLQFAKKDDKANIYVTPLGMTDFDGITAVFPDGVCILHVDPAFQYKIPLYIHEIGHCIGFAHNDIDLDSIMRSNTLSVHFEVDAKTATTLKELIKKLGDRK